MATKPPSPDASWRDSARPSRLAFIDAKAAFPLLLFLFHIRWWTFIIGITMMLFFTLLNRYGFSVNVFLRWLRSAVAGPRKEAIPAWLQNWF